ncbi:MAG: FkbM family methyltransferase [Clostridium sp.]|nr:FkbM family methyltransferase [Clostridium sp.]
MMRINKQKICRQPFEYCEISLAGNVYPCCPAYCKNYSFGNIFEQTLEEIWNGEKAKAFRKNIIERQYIHCDFNNCMSFADIEKQEIPAEDAKIFPRTLVVSFDKECNVACITCRDNIARNTKEDEDRLELFTKNIWTTLDKVETVYLSGSGDPFGSRYARNLIKKISTNFPHIKFIIHTNGVLFTQKMYKDLGLKDRIETVLLSIHAAKKETYNKIVKYGNFKKVVENIKWLSKEKAKGKIKNILLLFVVHKLNYKDMPNFVKLAQKYNCNVTFTHYRQWGTSFKYDDNAIFDPKFPEYWKFCEVMKNSVFNSPICEMDSMLEKAKKVSPKDINKMKLSYYKNNFKIVSKKIFSVYNENNHKIFEILGLKFKVKYQKFCLKKELEDLKNLEINNQNTINNLKNEIKNEIVKINNETCTIKKDLCNIKSCIGTNGYLSGFEKMFGKFVSSEHYGQNICNLLDCFEDEDKNQILSDLQNNYVRYASGGKIKFNELIDTRTKLAIEKRDAYMAQKVNKGDYWELDNYKLPVDFFLSEVFFNKLELNNTNKDNFINRDIIDAGACIGDSALILSEFTNKKVYAFEPGEKNFKLMEKTILLNEKENIVPVMYGLGNKEETLYLNQDKISGNIGGSYLADSNIKEAERVNIIPLDKYVRENNLDVGLIKIDVEGFEQNVLEGAYETIKNCKPTLLISIYHKPDDFFKIPPMLKHWYLNYKFKYQSLYAYNDFIVETIVIAEPN